jgi:hypothetical protein
MPPNYKYGFLPKKREKALEAAAKEFRACVKSAKQLEADVRALNARMDIVDGLLMYGALAVWPSDERDEYIKRIVDAEE